MELTAVPGVGEKTAAALSELDEPERALREGDVATLASAPGIGDGRAARLARAGIRTRHDDPGGFAATERAAEIREELLAELQSRTVTDRGAARLATLYPSSVRSRIEEVRAFSRAALARDLDDESTVRAALAELSPLSDPSDLRVRDRCLVTADAETYARARDRIPEVSTELVEDRRELAELAQGYATVIAVDEAFAGIEIEGVRVEPDALEAPARVVPERVLGFFARNRDSLRAAARVHRLSDLDPPVELDRLEGALDRLAEDGSIAGDAELDRLAAAAGRVETTAEEAERLANRRLREAIEQRDVTIQGQDLLALIERGASADSLLTRELDGAYAAAVEAARTELIEALGLEERADLARRAFADEPTYPVARDEAVVRELRDQLTAARDRRSTRRKRELAAELAGLREDCEALVEAAVRLDAELAVAGFAREYDCTMPTIGGEGFEIVGGRSPLLGLPAAEIEPVEYAVTGVRLLSGVNSGGKTSALDLVAAVATLAHMGLPVPADDARIERLDELHYHAKARGTLDAGAFEATLREFGELATTVSADRSVLVLADEPESITEPGASAIIVAGVLEALAQRGATAVFVSHLAREIREAAAAEIGVDGIAAEGLEDGRLVVDRSPVRGRLARSTPELIVEKLADDDPFYRHLLEKF